MNVMRMVTDRLCTGDPEWEYRELVDEAAVWKKSGILKPNRRRSSVWCTCGESHVAEVEDGPRLDGSYGPIAYCCRSGHFYPVEKEDLISYSFDANRMMEVLAGLLRCRGDVVAVIPGRLWKIGKSGVAIGGRSREIYFAPRLTKDADSIYDRLPDTKTPLLIVGSSHLQKDYRGRFDDSRVVLLDEILSVQKGEWVLDTGWLDTLTTDKIEEPPPPATRDSTGATVGEIKKALHIYLEAAFRNYCEQLTKGNGRQMPKERLTLTALAGIVGKDKSRISRLLEIRKPLDKCTNLEIRLMWDATQDIELMAEYGRKNWGRKYRGWE